MYLLICHTLEIRPVHYPFINQGTRSFSGRGINFYWKWEATAAGVTPREGSSHHHLTYAHTHKFQSECQGFLRLDLPCDTVSIPIYFNGLKDYHFLINFYLPMSGSASFTSSNYVTSFLLTLYLNVSNRIWFYSVLNILFRPRWLFLHSWNLLMLLR